MSALRKKKSRSSAPLRSSAEAAPSAEPTFTLETAGNALIGLDADGVIRHWNGGARRIFGYSRAEACGSSISLLLLPENRAKVAEHLSRLRRNPWIQYGEGLCLKKGARRIDVAFTLFSEPGADPAQPGVWLIVHDITARKGFERKMQEDLRRLEYGEDLARMGSWEWDVSADRITASKELHDLLGFPRPLKDASFLRLLRAIRPADRKRFKAGIERTLRDRVPFESRHAIRRSDGSEVEMLTHARVLEGPGKRLCLVGTSQEFGGMRPPATHALHVLQAHARAGTRSREHALLLVRSAALLFSSFDYESTILKTVKAIVPALADRCIVELEESGVVAQLSATPVSRGAGPSPPGWVRRENREGFNPGAPARVRNTGDYEIYRSLNPKELPGILPDLRALSLHPGLLPSSVVVVPLLSRGSVLGTLQLVQAESKRHFRTTDLQTAQKLAFFIAQAVEHGRLHAQAARKSDRLQTLNRKLEERVAEQTRELRETLVNLDAYAYTVAHDLRSPLRAVAGFSHALLEDCGNRLGPKGQDYLRRILDGCTRMDRFIEDLLTYSRVSRSDIEVQPVDLVKVVDDARLQVQADLASRRSGLEVQKPLPRVRGNPDLLVQVVSNLLSNAAKFVPPERRPSIRVTAEQKNAAIRLWIEDNGIGIAPEQRGRIFNAFERLNPPGSYPGTGLGLTIVQKAMERMNGRVGVESEPGRGSRFWIELPAAEA